MLFIDHRPWFSYRGLAPHQFMPMLGVHNGVNSDPVKLHRFALQFYWSGYAKR
jgi:hypothetical protein